VNKPLKILVIIPAYNEEKNIAETIREVQEKAPYVDILVVDDASQDKTGEMARQLGVPVVSHDFNLRIGGAVQTGLKIAKMNRYDIAIQVDGDGQHDPALISEIIKPLVESNSDIVIGSRYLKNENVDVSFTRSLGIRFFSWLTTKITGQRITDCTSGFRALNEHSIELFAKEYPTDFPDAEALIFAHRAGLEMTEIPVSIRSRERGRSSLNSWRLLYYPIKEIISIVMLLTKKQRQIK